MELIEFQDLSDPQAALTYLCGIEWGAGKHLAQVLSDGSWRATYGEQAALYFACENGQLLGFGAITERDYLPRPPLKPWIAFVYVDAKARGQRLSQYIVRGLEQRLAARGSTQVYLVSQHHGFYEKYGYQLLETCHDGIHQTDYLYGKTLG